MWWIAPSLVIGALSLEQIGKVRNPNAPSSQGGPIPISAWALAFGAGYLGKYLSSGQPMSGADAGPFKVVCRGSRESGGVYSSWRDAQCAAQNIADHEDTICMVMDRFGQGSQVMRGSGMCAARDPYPESVPKFHPHPLHPRSRVRYLRNEYAY